jgi:DNA modification methylase
MTELRLFGTDLFGEVVKPKANGPVAERFTLPPFTILDARTGEWQKRKRAWSALGIRGEIGRSASCIHMVTDGSQGTTKDADYTSIFDPTLVELAVRWFSPEGGQVVDPFAGGSVRGIVSGCLGRSYWGCDLRSEQIEANYEQARQIMPEAMSVPVRVSAPMLKQMFHPCDQDYVQSVCRGRCCERSSGGIMVTVHNSERATIAAQGGIFDGKFLAADARGLCQFKTPTHRCSIHATGQPFGCTASPFTLNDNDLLIVRNRYRLLTCYEAEGALPAYVAHRRSLDAIFGAEEAERIVGCIDAGEKEIAAAMPARAYDILKDNDDAKHGRSSRRNGPRLNWVCGDSMDTLADAPDADLVFSCPPYGDLERYSDDPRDLSAMEWHTFIAAYKRIILRAVKRMKPDSFACFVVGDFRDSRGFYRNFVSETIDGFEQAGARLYNEAILVTAVGSASMRVTKQFESGRKLAKTHQNVLVFCKGDWKKAAARCAAGIGNA